MAAYLHTCPTSHQEPGIQEGEATRNVFESRKKMAYRPCVGRQTRESTRAGFARRVGEGYGLGEGKSPWLGPLKQQDQYYPGSSKVDTVEHLVTVDKLRGVDEAVDEMEWSAFHEALKIFISRSPQIPVGVKGIEKIEKSAIGILC